MQPITPRNAEPFDLETVSKRNGEFLVTNIGLMLGQTRPGEVDGRVFQEQFITFMSDATSLLGEVKRLYDVLNLIKEQHMPLAGQPGATVLCTGCSLHGNQAPWPCENYRTVSAALPERRP